MWIRSICFLLFLVHGVSFWGVLPAEESGPWYLISETELRSIEQHKEQSEAERQIWLSQVRELKAKVENSAARSARLETESVSLNRQLAHAREAQRKSEQLFNEYEAEQLTLISSKNGEIAELKEHVADQTLKAEQYKRRFTVLLIVVSVLGLVVVSWITYKVFKLFKIMPG